ncbi:hypothetical protein GF339_12080 [candidate division KSB3 bacterium]|uniref:SOCS box domain-containing protein n=1 Tax=candidate division KSB3 bacterium TaxID=2044937 RepID=A0A9D5Q6E6_9BACT|nr:hypothetical protein [candidate division KSB3 bacterium]MBD3325318.1 hypothetical protein [candidate division KSB3 bacterium]
MFGILKFYRCSGKPDELDHYRRQYCGVCKTLGILYGQRTRLLLNRDLIFLSELLTALTAPTDALLLEDASPWQARRCLQRPRPEDIPLPLRLAATYNVLLSKYKLEDNVADASGLKAWAWKIGQRGLSCAVKKATAQMQTWHHLLAEVSRWMQEQREREAQLPEQATPPAILDYLAEPSAVSTGLSMQTAAEIAGHPDDAETMYHLGYAFGRLIYLVDALEDFEDDQQRGDFNAITAAYGLNGAQQIPESCREAVHALIQDAADQMQQHVAALPLPQAKRDYFTTRIAQNIDRTVGQPHCRASNVRCDVSRRTLPPMNLKEKWRYTLTLSKRLAFAGKSVHLLDVSRAYLTWGVLLGGLFLLPQSALAAVVNSLNLPSDGGMSGNACVSALLLSTWLHVLMSAMFRKKRRRTKDADADGCDCDECCQAYLCCECADCDCDLCDCAEGGCPCDWCACDVCDCAGCDCCDCDCG